MGIFACGGWRKLLTQPYKPEHLSLEVQHSELDRFSLEVGSPRSASGWVVPDSIISPASPTPKSHNHSSGDSFLRLRGGGMQDFDEYDPNSPTSLDRCLSWIDEDYHDQQFTLRQNLQATQCIEQRAELYSCGESIVPSVEDLDYGLDIDDFGDNTGGVLLRGPDSTSIESYNYIGLEEHNDSLNTALPFIGDWLQNIDSHDYLASALISANESEEIIYSGHSREPLARRTAENNSDQDHDVEDGLAHHRNQSFEDFAITDEDPGYDADLESAWSANRSILLDSDLPEISHLPDYEEFETSECQYDGHLGFSSANSQASVSNLFAHEVAGQTEECASHNCEPESRKASVVSESDFWAIAEELPYLISRYYGFFEEPFTCESKYESRAENEVSGEGQEQWSFDLLPTGAFHTSSLSARDNQAEHSSLREVMSFSCETTICQNRNESAGLTFFGRAIADRFTFTFEHDGPRYPSEAPP